MRKTCLQRTNKSNSPTTNNCPQGIKWRFDRVDTKDASVKSEDRELDRHYSSRIAELKNEETKIEIFKRLKRVASGPNMFTKTPMNHCRVVSPHASYVLGK